jgi:hypothetical protein
VIGACTAAVVIGAPVPAARRSFPFRITVLIQRASGEQWLRYRSRAGIVLLEPDRVDRLHSYGASIGYHLGRDLRIAVNADHYERRSIVPRHQYSDLTIGSSITYGQ